MYSFISSSCTLAFRTKQKESGEIPVRYEITFILLGWCKGEQGGK